MYELLGCLIEALEDLLKHIIAHEAPDLQDILLAAPEEHEVHGKIWFIRTVRQ